MASANQLRFASLAFFRKATPLASSMITWRPSVGCGARLFLGAARQDAGFGLGSSYAAVAA
jgi:hypothetical protein